MESRPGAARPDAHEPPLLERERERAQIVAALDAARAGTGQVIVLEGEAGSGKTRLLAEAVAIARERDLTVLSSRGAQLERRVAFGVVRRLVERPIAALSDTERRRVLSGAAKPLAALLDAAPVTETAPPDARFALAHAFHWACVRLCERDPAMLTIDDAHWADGPSAQALAYLGERIDELPAVLAIAHRSGEPEAPDPAGESERLLIRLEPLSPSATRSCLEGLIGSVEQSFATAAHRATAGNPFLLREVALAAATRDITTDRAGARQLEERPPGGVSTWASRRLEEMPSDCGALARSLAILERAELQVAGGHAGLSLDRARDAADRLAASGIAEPVLPLRLAHPLVRHALYEALPPATRDSCHRRAAELLHDRGAPGEAVAVHLLACEPVGDEWAVQDLQAAAGRALGSGAADEAAQFLRRALAEPGFQSSSVLLVMLARAELGASDPAALEHAEAAGRLADTVETRALALGTLGQARYLSGDFVGAFEAGRAALGELEPGHGAELEAELLIGSMLAGRAVPQLVDSVREGIARPRLGPSGAFTPAEAMRLHLRSLDAFLSGDRESALAGALALAAHLRDRDLAWRLPSMQATGPAFVLAGMGEFEAAEPIIDAGLERARQRGSRLELAVALHDRVWLLWRRGQVSRSLADAATIVELTAGAWDIAMVPMRVAQADQLVARGEIEAAAASLALPAELEERLPGTWGWVWLPWGRARLAIARGDWAAAHEQALECGRRAAEVQALNPEYLAWRPLAARAAARTGRASAGLGLARDDLDHARAIGAPRAAGTAFAAIGAIEGGEGGIESLRSACDELGAAGAGLELVRTRIELGIALRRARRPREAREPLRLALDAAAASGATALSEGALGELRAAGGQPRRERSSGPAALTPREYQTAILAAAGSSNRQIAEELFISLKTVESHLRSVFRKLGIESRDGIAGALGETA